MNACVTIIGMGAALAWQLSLAVLPLHATSVHRVGCGWNNRPVHAPRIGIAVIQQAECLRILVCTTIPISDKMVILTGRRPAPAATCLSHSRSKQAQSTSPASSNGVTRAVNTPDRSAFDSAPDPGTAAISALRDLAVDVHLQ